MALVVQDSYAEEAQERAETRAALPVSSVDFVQRRVAAESGVGAPRARSRSPPPTAAVKRSSIRSYRDFEMSQWTLKPGKDKKGNTLFNQYGPAVVNFHHFESEPTDDWSVVPYSVQLQDPEGKDLESFKLCWNVTEEQANWFEDVAEHYLVDQLTLLSSEFNGGKPMPRDKVLGMYRSPLKRGEGMSPIVKMRLVTRGPDRYHTKFVVFDDSGNGDWVPREQVLSGMESLFDLMGEHRFRNAQIRAHVRVSGVTILNRLIYPRWDVARVFIRMPSVNSSVGSNVVQMDDEEMKFMVGR